MKFDRSRTGGAGELDLAHPRDQLLQVHPELEPRQVRAQALVRARATERHMVGRVARDVEAVRVRVVVRVAVAGGEPDDDLVAGGDRHCRGSRCRASRSAGSTRPATSSGAARRSRRVDQRRVAPQPLPLIRVARRRPGCRARSPAGSSRCRRRSAARTCCRGRAGERAAVDLGVRDQREDVLAGHGAAVGVVLAAERAQLVGPGEPNGL